jgi:hypothetical protein
MRFILVLKSSGKLENPCLISIYLESHESPQEVRYALAQLSVATLSVAQAHV